MRTWSPLSLSLALLLGMAAVALSAQPAKPAADATATRAGAHAQVEALLAMPVAQRRAHLKALSPEQRRGLWFELKRTEVERRGVQSKKRGSGMTPHARAGRPAQKSPANVGTITYDSGAFSVAFGGGAIVGNRFDTHTGSPVFTSGTVSTIQAVVVQGSGFTQTTSNAGFVLEGPQTTMGGALAIFSTFTTATGTTDTLTFAGIGANFTANSFYVLFGDFASSYIPVFGTGTTMGQGHHGVVGYTGGMGPNITGTFNLGGTLNSFIRATGNIVPVELMKFTVDG